MSFVFFHFTQCILEKEVIKYEKCYKIFIETFFLYVSDQFLDYCLVLFRNNICNSQQSFMPCILHSQLIVDS